MAQASQKPFGVVTGASSGIGFELARQFAENGFDTLVVAEDADIMSVPERLGLVEGNVIPVQIDLAAEGGVERLWQTIESYGRPLEAIALNAGIGVGGPFAENSLEAEKNLVALNVVSTMALAKYTVQDMMRRNHGRILFTASVVSVMPAPFQAVYGASKAFVLSLSDALRNELKDTEITITALMPGATDTDFFERADLMDTKVGVAEKDDPADVARDGFKAMMAGDAHVIAHSFKNRLQGMLGELLPEGVKAEMSRKQSEPNSAKN